MVALHNEEYIKSHDGLSLFFQTWTPTTGSSSTADVLIVHGYGEHGGRYRELAHAFAEGGIITHTVDLRGHGRSDGRRGHVDHFAHYLNDVDCALEQLNHKLPQFILGHSLGGLISIDYVCSRQPPINGLIVSNPFLALAMEVPALKLKVAEIAGNLAPRFALPNGLKSGDISRVAEIANRYERDPLIFSTATAGWVREANSAQDRVRAYDRVTAPLYYLYSDSDPIACPNASRILSKQLRSPDKTIEERPDELHEILNEIDRHQLHKDVASWIQGRL